MQGERRRTVVGPTGHSVRQHVTDEDREDLEASAGLGALGEGSSSTRLHLGYDAVMVASPKRICSSALVPTRYSPVPGKIIERSILRNADAGWVSARARCFSLASAWAATAAGGLALGLSGCGGVALDASPGVTPVPEQRVWHLVVTPKATRLSELVGFGSEQGPLDEQPGTRVVVAYESRGRGLDDGCDARAVHILRAHAASGAVAGAAAAPESVWPTLAGTAQESTTWTLCFQGELFDPTRIALERSGGRSKRGTCWDLTSAAESHEFCQALVAELARALMFRRPVCMGDCPELDLTTAELTEQVVWRASHPPELVATVNNPAGAAEASLSLPDGGFNVKLAEYARHLVVACAYAAQPPPSPESATEQAVGLAWLRTSIAFRVAVPGLPRTSLVAFEGGNPVWPTTLAWQAASMGLPSCADVRVRPAGPAESLVIELAAPRG